MVRSLSTLEEGGLLAAVGGFVDQLYGDISLILDYVSLADRFEEVAKQVPIKYRELFQLFNPIGHRTEVFISAVAHHYKHSTLGSAIKSVTSTESIPQKVFAEGIMSTRLNLPYPLYIAIEETYLPFWRTRETGPAFYNASQRYRSALKRVEQSLINT